MRRDDFVEEMSIIQETLVSLLAEGNEEKQEKIMRLFEDLIKQAGKIKESDEEKLPGAFVAMGTWLGDNHNYHPILKSTRNLLIEYIGLDLNKQ